MIYTDYTCDLPSGDGIRLSFTPSRTKGVRYVVLFLGKSTRTPSGRIEHNRITIGKVVQTPQVSLFYPNETYFKHFKLEPPKNAKVHGPGRPVSVRKTKAQMRSGRALDYVLHQICKMEGLTGIVKQTLGENGLKLLDIAIFLSFYSLRDIAMYGLYIRQQRGQSSLKDDKESLSFCHGVFEKVKADDFKRFAKAWAGSQSSEHLIVYDGSVLQEPQSMGRSHTVPLSPMLFCMNHLGIPLYCRYLSSGSYEPHEILKELTDDLCLKPQTIAAACSNDLHALRVASFHLLGCTVICPLNNEAPLKGADEHALNPDTISEPVDRTDQIIEGMQGCILTLPSCVFEHSYAPYDSAYLPSVKIFVSPDPDDEHLKFGRAWHLCAILREAFESCAYEKVDLHLKLNSKEVKQGKLAAVFMCLIVTKLLSFALEDFLDKHSLTLPDAVNLLNTAQLGFNEAGEPFASGPSDKVKEELLELFKIKMIKAA